MGLLNALAEKIFPSGDTPDSVVTFNPKDQSDDLTEPGTVAAFEVKYGDKLEEARVLVVDVVEKVNYYTGPRVLTPAAISALAKSNAARRKARLSSN